MVWRSRFVEAAKAHPVTFAILAAGFLLVMVAMFFYLSGFIKQNIMGEAFYDFQFPYRNSFSEGWKIFFEERIRSRLMHGVLVSALYHGFGFNPPAFYLAAFFLIIGAAIFATLSLRFYLKSPWIAAMLVAAFTWMPLNIPDLISLKKIHHALAWFAFWLAVFLWQKWVGKRRTGWLFAATFAFLISVLAYEVAIALLPVAVLLSLPKLKEGKDFLRNLGLVIWITLLSGLAFLNLESLKPYSGAESVYAAGGWDIGILLANALSFLPRLPSTIWSSGLLEAGTWLRITAQIIIAASFVLGILALWNTFHGNRKGLRDKYLALIVSGIWLAIGGYLPYILAGQGPDSDGLRGAAFGVLIVALAAGSWIAQQKRERLGSLFVSVVCIFWVVAGISVYSQEILASKQDDLVLRNVVITLKQQVPDVADGSNFIFVNSGLGRTGCIGFVNMLYDKANLHCIHLLSGDTQESYTRTEGGLLETGDRLWPNRFIIVTFDNLGKVTLINELDADDYSDLPLTWGVSDPLRTNRSLIYEAVYNFGRNFDFYEYMVNQSSGH